MTSRQRVLEVLAGRSADRVPVAFEFGPLEDHFRTNGISDPDSHFAVDLKKLWFIPQATLGNRQADDELPEATPPDAVLVGSADQRANYRLWDYAPQCIDRRHPLVDARCPQDLATYRFPSLDAPGEADRLGRLITHHHAAGRAVAGQIPYLGGVVFETAYRLRGLDNLLEDLRERPAFAEALLDQITDNAAGNVAHVAAAGAEIVFLGDDIGMPASMLISPAWWRSWFKPRLARIIQAARAISPTIHIAYHSDGWYWPVVDDLVELGVSILNPVQPDCMDPLKLHRRFGRRLTLWGTVGSASLMAFGTPQDVYREVRRRVEELAASGGLILAPAYDLEGNVPLANVEAFFGACRLE